jgi:endonuclease G
MRFTKGLITYLLAVALAALPAVAGQHGKPGKGPNRNIRLGMPSQAKADPQNREEYLIERPQYVVSYNDKKKTPNWVSWQLVKEDLGHIDRGPFSPDPLLPKTFTRIISSDYNGSGFDRGHMCPSAHRADSQENNDETFVMTNIIPQAPNNNRKGWERLETYCRDLAKEGKELQIVCGPHGVGGFGSGGFATSIGSGKHEITVPAHTWKVILVLPKTGAQPTKRARTIAVIMPNSQKVDHNWPEWRVSVRDVEKLTGYTFWSEIDAEVAEVIKAAPDDTDIEVPIPKFKKKQGGGQG